jgi:hypothetical protein
MTAAGAAGLGPATPLQRVVHPALVPLYLGNIAVWGRFEPHRTAGFACRLQDVVRRTAAEVEAAYGLDKTPGWPAGGPVHVLRFFTHRTALWATTFGGNTVDGARGGMVYPPPFLGTGYTPGGLPEYASQLMELPAGTELWRIDPDGGEHRVGRYAHRQLGWTAVGATSTDAAGFGPPAWFAGPAPLRPTVRRGLVARYRDTDFDADFGPRADEVTLHPLPGATAPTDFDERDGTWSKVVKDVELDGLAHLRQRCTWRGAQFELAASNPSAAVLHHLGHNADEATALGLTQTDLHVWQTVVPTRELTDVHPELTPLPPEGQFPSA